MADAYDAMTSPRPYRPALAPDAVRRELETCAGSQFDPDLAKAFLALVESGGLDDDAQRVAEALGLTRSLRSGGAGRAVDPFRGMTR